MRTKVTKYYVSAVTGEHHIENENAILDRLALVVTSKRLYGMAILRMTLEALIKRLVWNYPNVDINALIRSRAGDRRAASSILSRNLIVSQFIRFTRVSFCPMLRRRERAETQALARGSFST